MAKHLYLKTYDNDRNNVKCQKLHFSLSLLNRIFSFTTYMRKLMEHKHICAQLFISIFFFFTLRISIIYTYINNLFLIIFHYILSVYVCVLLYYYRKNLFVTYMTIDTFARFINL